MSHEAEMLRAARRLISDLITYTQTRDVRDAAKNWIAEYDLSQQPTATPDPAQKPRLARGRR